MADKAILRRKTSPTINALLAENERLRGALEDIAALNDVGANLYLENSGSYGCFDEPCSVQMARAALKEDKP